MWTVVFELKLAQYAFDSRREIDSTKIDRKELFILSFSFDDIQLLLYTLPQPEYKICTYLPYQPRMTLFYIRSLDSLVMLCVPIGGGGYFHGPPKRWKGSRMMKQV